jgi:hypothetical protein
MEELDTDGDGKLSPEERQAARENRPGRKNGNLKRFDADGDGVLSDEEKEQAKAAREKHRKRKGRGPGDRPAVDQPGNAPQ